jgi:antitoxin CptB
MSVSVENLKKKLIYRSKYRACKENDILIGNYVANFISSMSLDDLASLDEILNREDLDLFRFLSNHYIEADDLKNNKLLNDMINYYKNN